MKYIAKTIEVIILSASKILCWSVIQIGLVLWHFSFSKCESYKSFFKVLESKDLGASGKRALTWILTFMVFAIISAVFGFGGFAVASSTEILARIMFFIFTALFILSLVFAEPEQI